MRFPLQEPVKICWKISWTLRIQWNSRDLRHLLVGALFHWIYLSPLELPDVLHTCWCSRDLMVICAFQKQCKSALGWPMFPITLNPSKVRDETSNETSNDSNDKWQKAKSIALIESPIATVEKDLCQKKGAPWHTFCVKPELCHMRRKVQLWSSGKLEPCKRFKPFLLFGPATCPSIASIPNYGAWAQMHRHALNPRKGPGPEGHRCNLWLCKKKIGRFTALPLSTPPGRVLAITLCSCI